MTSIDNKKLKNRGWWKKNAKDSWREMKHWHGNYNKRRKCNFNSKQNELWKKEKLWRNSTKYKNNLLKTSDSN